VIARAFALIDAALQYAALRYLAARGIVPAAVKPEPVPCCYCGKPRTGTWCIDDDGEEFPLCKACFDGAATPDILAKLAADRAKAEAPAPLCGARDCRNPGCRPEVKP